MAVIARTSGIANKDGKRNRRYVRDEDEKRSRTNENRPFVPILQVDIRTGKVECFGSAFWWQERESMALASTKGGVGT